MMMKPVWVIENFERNGSDEKLVEAAKRAGCDTKTVDYVPFDDHMENFKQFIQDDSCVVFQGSVQFAKRIQRERSDWIPGVWCSWHQYECTNYYAHWGEYLLNSDYIMLPLGEVDRRSEELFERFGGRFFMRPSSGDKSFSGTVISYSNGSPTSPTWSEWKRSMTEAKIADIVVVAEPKLIHEEWRVICSGDRIVTGSRYKIRGGSLDGRYKRGIPDKVEKFVSKILKSSSWRPDPIFAVDICKDFNGNLHLLEIGSYSVSGLYECDHDLIVEAVNSLAVESFNNENKTMSASSVAIGYFKARNKR